MAKAVSEPDTAASVADAPSAGEPAGTQVPPERTTRRGPRWRRIMAGVLVVLACILAPVSVLGVWLHDTLLETDQYVDTVGPLARDPDVQQAIANRVTNGLVARSDLEARVAGALPNQASFAAPAVAQAIEGVVFDVTLEVVQSDQFRTLWEETNRRAHTQIVAVLQGKGSDTIETANGQVVVDLGPVVARVNEALQQRGINVFSDAQGQVNDRFVLLDSEKLRKAQDGVDLLDKLAIILPILTIALLVVAVLLSPRRRRTVLRAALGIAFAMALVLIALNVGRSFYLDALGPDVSQDAAASIYDQLVEFLRTSLRAGFVLGALVAVGAWLVGPGQVAGKIRNATVGVFGGRARTPDTEPSALAAFALRYRSGLRVVTVGIGVAILVALSHPGPVGVLTVAIIVLLGLAIIEGLSRTAITEAPQPS